MLRIIFLIILAVLIFAAIGIGVMAVATGGRGMGVGGAGDGLALAGALLMPLVITGILFLSLVVFAVRRVRRHRSARIVEYLSQCVKLNLPLPQAIAAAARSETGRARKELNLLERNLASGATVGACLRAALPRLPQRDTQLVEAGEQMGRLGPSLEAVAKEGIDRSRSADVHALPMEFIIMITLMMTGHVVTGLSVFILPKYEKIFEDFDVTLPAWTVSVMESGAWFALFGLVLMSALLLMVGRDLATLFADPRQYGAWWQGLLVHLFWWTPARGALRDRALAGSCFLLAEGAAAGMALPDALDVTAASLGSHPFGANLARWSLRLREGEDVQEAARGAGMPPLVCAMFGSARGRDGFEAAAMFLHRYYTGRFSRVAMVARSLVEPTVVLFAAVLVTWVVIGLFLPLVKLIHASVIETGMF